MRVLIAVAPLISHRIAPAERAYTFAKTLKNRGHEVQVWGYDSPAWNDDFAPKFKDLGMAVTTSAGPKPHIVSKTRTMCVLPFTRKARNPQLLNEERNLEETFNNAGILDHDWYESSFDALCKLIRSFRPDMVYSEYDVVAIAAAKFLEVPECCTENYYAIPGYSAGSIRSMGVADVLEKHHLPRIQECSDLFEWCEQRFVPSIIELDPFRPQDVMFVGTFSKPKAYSRDVDPRERPAVLFSTINEAVSDQRVVREATKAFRDTHEVYITGLKKKSIESLESKTPEHVHLSSVDDVQDVIAEVMPKAVMFVNCGQADQVLTAMASKVPQCICPGDAFEGKYLAYSLRMAHAAMYIGPESFVAYGLKEILKRLTSDDEYVHNARQIAKKMMEKGGTVAIVKEMEQMVRSGVTSKPVPSLDEPKNDGKGGGGNATAESDEANRAPWMRVFGSRRKRVTD